MATHSTIENDRLKYTTRTLESLKRTVDWDKHRLIVVDNNSCKEMHEIYKLFSFISEVIYFKENKGTAVAINTAWKQRGAWEHAVKMDDDVEIHKAGWADLMEVVFEKDPTIGICGLKRKDLEEWPLTDNDWFRSTLRALPHERGEPWLIVEKVFHVMGTCQAYNKDFLQEMGFLYQMQDKGNLYGFDDSLAAVRADVAGFQSVFLHGVEIDHIDPGGNDYIEWKQENAGKWMRAFNEVKGEYQSGRRDIYYPGP